MRLLNDDKEFKEWCLNIGGGITKDYFEDNNNVVEIPQRFLSNGNLIEEIFGNHINGFSDDFKNNVILAPKNEDVIKINMDILDKLDGNKKVYVSIDRLDEKNTVPNMSNSNYIPLEFLNSLIPNGLPLHKLELIIGAIVILLRNLNVKEGLCNGTRMQIISLRNYVIEAKILSGSHKNKIVLLPRIYLRPNKQEIPIDMIRRQYPIRLGSAITINKSQGQSFEKVGIYLPSHVFSHGQLYVAILRVRLSINLKILSTEDSLIKKDNGFIKKDSNKNKKIKKKQVCYTKNVVFTEVLD